ncbi:Pycsar system effector family protein [Amycolatopsis cihanbeyliensis]|uniref:Pycsar effector protein domain-containing protein n=1 Tax=Amycolatopsis cihanbeyliensis TaxID=1128664 RepID=A0A542DJI6_AMYCI|nr:Pycsar system effector family protein [Amycolatopsis cihanbeyliensis]TQJ03258.1 hypothetical protein FB471_3013 [Amycolatopsis cihanbeyliensis]
MSSVAGFPSRLEMAHEQARDELRRADTKATTLLSLVGVALAGLIALTTREVSVAAIVALWAAVLPVAVAVLLLLSAVRPRLSQYPPPGTWLHAAYEGPTALLEATSEAAQAQVAEHVCQLGSVAVEKYRRVSRAISALTCGLSVLLAALVLAVVA